MNNQLFIKSLNSIANNYTFAVKAPIPTVLYTAEPMEEDAPVSESDDYSFLYWLAGALGLSAAVAALWARSQNIQKFKECSKLINRHLKLPLIFGLILKNFILEAFLQYFADMLVIELL